MKDLQKEVCDRADDLIGFIYGELDAAATRRFKSHLHECARCESELSSFGQIRQSIVSWRDESLGVGWSASAVNGRSLTSEADLRKTEPSALAAIREFFTLSPVWMKGAAAFASMLFCVCAVLAITYLRDRQSRAIQVQSKKIYSQQELDARLAQEKQKLIESQQQQARPTNEIIATTLTPKKTDNRMTPPVKISYAVNTRDSRKPLTRQERQELAADLGLSATHEEDDLDIIGDRINQTP